MKALILAGGFGTRLRPLSCTRPKLLFPICNKPLLDWTLENLASSKIDSVILALNYMADMFIDRYGKSKYGMDLIYLKENKPLGTGGPIKNAEEQLGYEEPFLVLNGDILTNIDYSSLTKKHKLNETIATIALHRVDDPKRYGVVDLSDNGHVTSFLEKPSNIGASTLINAGIYVLDQRIFDYIPRNERVSLEREVFPKLAGDEELYGYSFDDLWIDIGKYDDYLAANQLMLRHSKEYQKSEKENLFEMVEIKNPISIDKGVNIGEKSRIGPYVSVGENVSIGKGVLIENSVILPKTTISDFSSIRGGVIGENSFIGRWVKIEDECIIGDYALINDNVTLTRGVTVCPFKEVRESVLTSRKLM
jgi:mannose-1-phosphate guanylyltransferase